MSLSVLRHVIRSIIQESINLETKIMYDDTIPDYVQGTFLEKLKKDNKLLHLFGEKLRPSLPPGQFTLYGRSWNDNFTLTVFVTDLNPTLAFDERWIESNALQEKIPSNAQLQNHVQKNLKRMIPKEVDNCKIRIEIRITNTDLRFMFLAAREAWGLSGTRPEMNVTSEDPILEIPGITGGFESPRQRKNGTKVYHHAASKTIFATFQDPEFPNIFKYVRKINVNVPSGWPKRSQDQVMGTNMSPSEAAARIKDFLNKRNPT